MQLLKMVENHYSQISTSEKLPIADQTISAIQSTQKDLFGVVQEVGGECRAVGTKPTE